MNKLTALRAEMKKQGVDAIISLDELNQHYLSGFAFTDGYLLITEQNAYLVTDFRYTEHARMKADPAFTVLVPENRTTWLAERFAEEGVHTVGMEGESVPFAVLERYRKAHPGVEFVDFGRTVETLRQIKTPEELECMRRAQSITDLAFAHILKVLSPEMTEIEVAAELEYVMRKNGASGLAFDTIAVSGDASALPHGTPRNVKLKRGFLTMDFGAKYDGYCSDMTRTVVMGRADADVKRVYETVLSAQCAALAMLREGVDCAEADKVARDIIDRDYRGAFGHSLGHSVGLFIHEAPSLSSRMTGRKLRCGEIVTVEPGIYLEGKYGCRIEDMVAIREGGIEDFTKSPKELIEIL